MTSMQKCFETSDSLFIGSFYEQFTPTIMSGTKSRCYGEIQPSLALSSPIQISIYQLDKSRNKFGKFKMFTISCTDASRSAAYPKANRTGNSE